MWSKKKSSKSSMKPTQLSFSKGKSIKPTPKSNHASFQPSVKELKAVFENFDINKDGKISMEEFKSARRALEKGVSDKEVVKGFQAIDIDGDGFIDFKEFMEVFSFKGKYHIGDEKEDDDDGITNAFKVFDLDGDGKICAEELMEVLKKLGNCSSLKACRQMVKGADIDGDGFIDIHEFVNMMSNKKFTS